MTQQRYSNLDRQTQAKILWTRSNNRMKLEITAESRKERLPDHRITAAI